MGGDQDLLPASRHGSTGSRPDISGNPRDSPFQGSAASVNCGFDYTYAELTSHLGAVLQDDHGTGICCDDLDNFDIGGLLQPCSTEKPEEDDPQSCTEKPEEDDQKPQNGMMFSSWIEAEEFYNKYAKKTGFTVRRGKTYRKPDGTLKWRRFLCSCEGFRAKKQSNQGTKYQRSETRTGCEAQMQVTNEKEKWVITNLCLDHNHCLNNSNQSPEMADGLLYKVENRRHHPQQTTEEHSACSHLESSSMAEPSDEVEAPCGDQLPMEEGSLPFAGSASLPIFIPTPTLPYATMTSCPQDKPSGALRDKGKQSTNLGRVNNTIAQLSHDETIWQWQQILTKYGDITAKCTLTSPEFVDFVKQSILKIVELLRNNTVRDLSEEDISTIGRLLSDLEHLGVKVDWLRSRFVEVGHLLDYLSAKDRMEETLRRIGQLKQTLDLEQTNLQMLQSRIPGWLTIDATLGEGLL